MTEKRNIRFAPDPESIAQLDFDKSHNVEQFKAQANALIIDESFKGCGLVAVKREDQSYTAGNTFLATVGHLGPMVCEVKWVKELDDKLVRIGLEYQN